MKTLSKAVVPFEYLISIINKTNDFKLLFDGYYLFSSFSVENLVLSAMKVFFRFHVCRKTNMKTELRHSYCFLDSSLIYNTPKLIFNYLQDIVFFI